MTLSESKSRSRTNICITLSFFLFKESALGRFFHRVAMSVKVCVPVFGTFHVSHFEAYFAPTSRSRMTKIFRDSEYIYVWKLKELGLVPTVSWKIIDRGKKFSPISRSCKLCTLERYILICRPNLYTLNKNKEFGDECLHKRFSRLSKVK